MLQPPLGLQVRVTSAPQHPPDPHFCLPLSRGCSVTPTRPELWSSDNARWGFVAYSTCFGSPLISYSVGAAATEGFSQWCDGALSRIHFWWGDRSLDSIYKINYCRVKVRLLVCTRVLSHHQLCSGSPSTPTTLQVSTDVYLPHWFYQVSGKFDLCGHGTGRKSHNAFHCGNEQQWWGWRLPALPWSNHKIILIIWFFAFLCTEPFNDIGFSHILQTQMEMIPL